MTLSATITGRIVRLLALSSLAWSLPAGNTNAEIRIGVIGPTTGQFRSFGEQMQVGAARAVADINAAGGINGEQIVLETANDRCDAERATAVANQMVGRNVVAIIGHLCSAASSAASQVYSNAGVIQISPASASPSYTDNRPDPAGGTYRLYGREDDQPKIAGQFLARRFGNRKIAFVHDGTAYGKGLADATMRAFEAAGGKPAFTSAYDSGQQDYSSLVATLDRQAIEVLFLGGYHADAGLIVGQMRQRGMDTVLMGGDALLTEEFRNIAGTAADGTLVTYPPSVHDNSSASRIIERFRADGIEPEAFTIHSFAAVQVWAQAAKQAGSTSYGPVSRALNEGRFSTVIGDLAFNSRGDMTLPGYVVYQWQDGWYKELPVQN